MLYSYAGFTVKVFYEGGRVRRLLILGETTEELPPLPLSIKPDFSGFTSFERAVMEKAMEIPPGRVATYASLAEAAGYPGAARAAGSVMAKNPFPIVVPCHRVVRSDLRIGNYAYGSEVKRRLLEAEGVEFAGDRVRRPHLWKFK